MKKILILLWVLPLILVSCESNDAIKPEAKITGHYVLNYGSYSSTVGSLSHIDLSDSTVRNGVYESINGVPMSGKPQYACEYHGKIYFMGNAVDEIFHVDAKTLIQSKNGVSDGILKPRFCVGHGDYLYISCWGGDVWGDTSLGYIARYNITTDEVEGTIDMPGGPEGLAIVDGTLYCALNYDKRIGMVDLATEEVSFIENMPGVSSYFLKDKENNLYVGVPDSYTVPATTAGLCYINTTTNQIENTFELVSITSNYASTMAFNKDQSIIYIVGGGYDANWNFTGSVYVFDTTTQTFDPNPLITGVSSVNGLYFNKQTEMIYVMISENTTANGLLRFYDTSGEQQLEFKTGISPTWILDVE